MESRLLTRIVLRNYKSIGACDVRPAQLSFLVGPNGSGKSNFLDALRFVADSTRFSIDQALRDRGGINEVRRRSGGDPTHFGIRLEFDLGDAYGHYAFNVGAKPRGGFDIRHEECLVAPRGDGRGASFYKVENGALTKHTFAPAPAVASDRLYLVNVSGLAEFRPVYEALAGMGFYDLDPEKIRDLQSPDPGELLKRDGSNIASVLSNILARSPELKQRIEEYLSKVVPGITGVDSKILGLRETLEFRQQVPGAEYPWRSLASNMSDGALRAFAVLVATFQGEGNGSSHRRLFGIEQPELGLHPSTAGVLMDSLREASERAQILVTSHSPDLLDDDQIPDEAILAALAVDGETRIGQLDEAERSALRDHLYTAGELLRMDQLRPENSTGGAKTWMSEVSS